MDKTKPYHDLVLHVSWSAVAKCFYYQIVYNLPTTFHPIIFRLWFHLGQELGSIRYDDKRIRLLTYCLADETNKTIGSWSLFDARLAAVRIVNRIFKHYKKNYLKYQVVIAVKKKGGRK
jgi:hypothetical protein